MRIGKGYKSARRFAQSIGIHENRYSRYERGDAEPNIGLVYQICETLGATPNELFGHIDSVADRGGLVASRTQPGFAEPPHVAVPGSIASEARQWRLAKAIVAARKAAGGGGADSADPDLLNGLQAAAVVFSEIERHPYRTIAAVLAEPKLASLPRKARGTLQKAIDGFLETLESSYAT